MTEQRPLEIIYLACDKQEFLRRVIEIFPNANEVIYSDAYVSLFPKLKISFGYVFEQGKHKYIFKSLDRDSLVLFETFLSVVRNHFGLPQNPPEKSESLLLKNGTQDQLYKLLQDADVPREINSNGIPFFLRFYNNDAQISIEAEYLNPGGGFKCVPGSLYCSQVDNWLRVTYGSDNAPEWVNYFDHLFMAIKEAWSKYNKDPKKELGGAKPKRATNEAYKRYKAGESIKKILPDWEKEREKEEDRPLQLDNSEDSLRSAIRYRCQKEKKEKSD